jgi:hypothetical protein
VCLSSILKNFSFAKNSPPLATLSALRGIRAEGRRYE